jgi:hypothetical protein
MIVFSVTFILFFMESMIHYNLGKKEESFQFPDRYNLCIMIVTVSFFSLLNSSILRYLAEHYNIH